MTTPTIADAMRLARINRTKARTNAWWHATHCDACKARAAGQSPLHALITRLAGGPPDELTDPPTHKQSTH